MIQYADTVWLYIILGWLSVGSTCIIAFLHVSNKEVRGDPSSKFILLITLADLLYSLKFMISAIAFIVGNNDDTHDRDSFHLVDDQCLSAVIVETFTSATSVSLNAVSSFTSIAMHSEFQLSAGF